MARATWMQSRVEALLAELARLGITASARDATELIAQRVSDIAYRLGVTELTARRYVDDRAIGDLAQLMVSSVADEMPGVDVLALPRTGWASLETMSRGIAALAEAAGVFLAHDDPQYGAQSAAPLVHTVSAFAQILAGIDGNQSRRAGPAGVAVPPVLLSRAARYLDTCAGLLAAGELHPVGVSEVPREDLAAVLRRDAIRLRTSVG